MSLIVLRRIRQIHYADGRVEVQYIEERHNWPAMTCNNFKRAFPDAVVSIDHGYRDSDPPRRVSAGGSVRGRRDWTTESGNGAPVSSASSGQSVRGVFSLADAINEAVAKLT